MALDAAALQRLSSLLDEALDLPADEREHWLDALPEDARPHAGRLRALLQRHAEVETDDFALKPPWRDEAVAAAGGAGADAGAAPGTVVGPYRLLRELGRGGMGTVWLAERADGQLRRQVALKLPHLGWTPGLAERFAREREILASLEHPNIARLYDAGVDARGRPFMALEFVEGRPIDVHCRETGLDIPARLRLLLQVADAVAHAHGRLVLHRDLKPGNILVTVGGQVRLLDFGISKLMAGEHAEATALTQAAGRPLTPAYASPEQLRGEPLGTASDVWSLGAVAFELLTGERVHPTLDGLALEAAIVGEEAPRASQRVADPALRAQLRGDLDAILLKALQRPIAERYATVDAFAQDLRRHLEGARVLARRDTWAYRLLRLARRRRVPLAAAAAVTAAFGVAVGVGATALLVGVLALGLGAALLLLARLRRERDRALELAERNAAGNRFIETLLTRAARGGAFTALQLIERGESLLAAEAEGPPRHRAYVLGQIAGFYLQLDQHARALPLLERAIEAAREGRDAPLRAGLEGRRAVALGWLGRTDEALALSDRLLAAPDHPPELRSELHAGRARIAHVVGDFPATLHHATEALRWHRASVRPERRREPVLLAELGWAALKNGDAESAERHFAAATAGFAALGLADSGPALQYGSTRALMVQERGDLRRAIDLYDALRAAWQRAMPDLPPSVFLQANQAYALAHQGRFDDAEAAYRDSARLAGEQELHLIRYNILLLLVELFVLRGHVDAARTALEQAQAARTSEVPEGGPAEFARQQAEAQLALAEGRPALAVQVFGEALASRHVAAGTANALLGRSAAHLIAGQLVAAEVDARDALDIAERLRGSLATSSRSGLAWLALARVHLRRGEREDARRCALAAEPHLRAQLDPRHPARAEATGLATVASKRALQTSDASPPTAV